MRVQFSPTTLRVEPGAIPAVRTAVDDALTELSSHLVRLGQEGYIPEPWLGDPVSGEVVRVYRTQVMDSVDGPYAAMVALEAELLRIRDALQTLEDHYRRAEGDNTALWGRA